MHINAYKQVREVNLNTLCIISTAYLCEKGKAMETIKRSVTRDGEGGREIGREQRIFRVVKILCEVITMDICPYTFVKNHRMANSKSEP